MQAIIAGRKTVTRRVVAPQPVGFVDGAPCSRIVRMRDDSIAEHTRIHCPYDAEALWVREAWRPCMEGWRTYIEYRASGGSLNIPAGPEHDALTAMPKLSLRFPGARKERHSDAWRPSIYLPRWASRITLHGVTVRVERLHDIDEADARAEGVDTDGSSSGLLARGAFAALWDSINAARGYPWSANVWVWRVAWERAEVRT